MSLQLLNKRYQVLRTLGDGGFGRTFLAEDIHMPSKRKCVIKQLKPVHDKPSVHQLVQERFEREAILLETLGEGHDQIPGLYAYFPENGQFYLVQEWIQGSTLTQKVQQDGPQSEQAVQTMLFQLLPVVDFIHSQQIVHRDIKPDNIILRSKDTKPVLIDFGAVKEAMKTMIPGSSPGTLSIIVGTPGYMPSEQITGRPVYASDIYSLGLTAIYLLTGKHPSDIQSDISTGTLLWRQYAPQVSTKFANFLDCAIHSDPQSRFHTIEATRSALDALMIEHPTPQVPTYLSTPSSATPQPAASNINDLPRDSYPVQPPAAPIPLAPIPLAQTPPVQPPLYKRVSFAGLIAAIWLGGIVTAGAFLYRQTQAEPNSSNAASQSLESDQLQPADTNDSPRDRQQSDTESISASVDNNNPKGQSSAAVPVDVADKTEAEQINDIADEIFNRRYPARNGKKIQPEETTLKAEWSAIRACEATVDFKYYQRYPARKGQRIVPGDTAAQADWTAIKNTVAGCGARNHSSSAASTAKTRKERIDDTADALFFSRYPTRQGRPIQSHETALQAEWASIRACEAIVDFTYYERHPEQNNQKIADDDTQAQAEWLAIKRGVPGCN